MVGLFDMLRKNKIESIIGYLGLEDFWMSLSFEQSEAMIRYTRPGLGADPNSSPIEGKISHSSAGPLNLGNNWLTVVQNWQADTALL